MNMSSFIRGGINGTRAELKIRTGKNYRQIDIVALGLQLLLKELEIEIPKELKDPSLYRQLKED